MIVDELYTILTFRMGVGQNVDLSMERTFYTASYLVTISNVCSTVTTYEIFAVIICMTLFLPSKIDQGQT